MAEISEEVKNDPQAYWQNVHFQTAESCKALIGKSAVNLSNALGGFLTHLHNIICAQSAELALFRELETRIRIGNATEDDATRIFNDLNTLRTEQKAKLQPKPEGTA